MQLILSESDSVHLEFLRFALADAAPEPSSLMEVSWDALLDFANKHAITGIIFHGMNKLPVEGANRPSKIQVAKWFAHNQMVVANSQQAFRDSSALTAYLYSQGRIKTCVLKGQGNALMYPDPYMRTPGDIDLWTDCPTIPLLKFVKKIDPSANIEYHHVDLSCLTKTPAEIHFFPSFMGNMFYEYRLRKYFDRVKDQQFERCAELPDGSGRICVPTDSFNRMFQMSHIMHHFYFEGIGLRQIIDYYYLLRKGFTLEEQQSETRLLRRLNMYKFAKGVMWILSEVLGLERRYLLVESDPKVGSLLLEEILTAGNFGHYDERYKFEGKSPYLQYFIEIWRNLRFAFVFPSETLWGRPISRWWHMIYKAYLRYRT